jgi:hypothetical protein
MGIESLMVAPGPAMDKTARSQHPSFGLQGAGGRWLQRLAACLT